MYVERVTQKRGTKTYEQVLVRESYREPGAPRSRVQKRTVMNITHLSREEQDALAFALRHPEKVLAAQEAPALDAVALAQGRSVGAAWVVVQLAQRLGLTKALGQGRPAQLALWQLAARVLEQGSRLSAVRLHDTHALAEVLGLERGFTEEDLYQNLAWLSAHQARIEDRLFRTLHPGPLPTLFLYDVTSSYLEGACNAFGAYGYNRDGKKGKQQIVVGLLCDGTGEPVSVEVFRGNTQDPQTLASQIQKTAERFGCEHVVFVGDRGMIKKGQREALGEAGFYYLTALTKPQIETLLAQGTLQLELFDTEVCEVQDGQRRLVLRRNPVRAQTLAATRADKQARLAQRVEEENAYLAAHPKASVDKALARVQKRIDRLQAVGWLRVEARERALTLQADAAALEEASRLDGCYVLVTDVPKETADAETVHARYKDLARVERAFRMAKTGHLELRPVYVRSEASTRGHVFVVMLAYRVRRALERAWRALDVTVEEGLSALSTLPLVEVTLGPARVHRVPEPVGLCRELLAALELTLPAALPRAEVVVATKRKLQSRRQSS